jgi:hypothetical protein
MSNVMDILGYLGTGVGTLVGVGGGIFGLVYMAKMTKGLTSEVSAITSHVNGIAQSVAPNMELLAAGEPTEATVVAAEETGLRLQGVPVLRILLDVRRTMGAAYRPEQQAYRIETKAMVPDLKFAQIQPGSLVSVRLDPRDLSKLALALR